ncbi:MAG: glutathione S-transferase family protein [bacterium]
MKLYFSRNYNPRLAVATARHLGAPVTFEFASPFSPDQAAKFLALNPNRGLPILVADDGTALWEADAIACYLSQKAGSDFWRQGAAQPDMIRWLSWGYWNFVRACDMVHFERVTKQRYGLGPILADKVAEGLQEFAAAANILQAELSTRDWLLSDGLSYVDFRLACVLPFADLAGLPLADYPAVQAWHNRLMQLPVWANPFNGLDAPQLPEIPS